MPASSPFLDQWAPPQWVNLQATPGQQQASAQGIAGTGTIGAAMNNAAQNTGFDTQLHFKVAGTIIVALVVIFALQAMGFRFVTSANATFGVGR